MPLVNLDKSKEVMSEFDKYSGSNALSLYIDLQKSKESLSSYLEKLDPSEKDENGNLVSPFDAFERHLICNELSLAGPNQNSVADFADKVQYLMPELIRREIVAGMVVSDKFNYKDCIAATVPSKTASYHPLYIPNQNLNTANSRREKSLGARAASSKGGEFPVVSIRRREKNITIDDDGRTIEAAYSVIKDYGWSDFAVFLRLIGAQISADKLQDVYDVGITGDGTVGAATNTFNGAAGTLAYTDLIRNTILFEAPFVMDRILAPQTSVETILALPQFQDPLAGWEFQKNGKMVTPMGAKIKQVNPTPNSTPTATAIVTLDSNFAVKEVVNEVLTVEAEKIINRKFESATVSQASRFCVIADGALRRIIWT